eukprot:TRINITY_DN28127_c0_g1_i1.p1 TRINITY_DN28127_c0_g1~~TRINITY_DN28127_c0_g1_i1.p1  ORF type:complete len:302 (+),score=77.14 TRINITY_DN28127_c0_g1_i1:69-974(+)
MASAAARASVQRQRDFVILDVRGRSFKVLPELLQSRPSTLLAQLLDDISTDPSAPIFVDVDPDRFPHILDYYKYGEMFPPPTVSVPALLRDAAFLLLPAVVIVNGARCAVRGGAASRDDMRHDHVVARVLAKWPGFDAFFEATLLRLRVHFEEAAERSDEVGHNDYDEYADHKGFKMFLSLNDNTGLKTGWCDPSSVCNIQRAIVLQTKLQERGLLCEWASSSAGFEGFTIRLPRAQLPSAFGASGAVALDVGESEGALGGFPAEDPSGDAVVSGPFGLPADGLQDPIATALATGARPTTL